MSKLKYQEKPKVQNLNIKSNPNDKSNCSTELRRGLMTKTGEGFVFRFAGKYFF